MLGVGGLGTSRDGLVREDLLDKVNIWVETYVK